MTIAPSSGHEPIVVNYVPRQVCVVAAPGDGALPSYDAVLQWLNARLRSLVRNPPKPPAGVEPSDVYPQILKSGSADRDLLAPLPDRSAPRRSVPFRPPKGNSKVLHFYGVDVRVNGTPRHGNDPVALAIVKLINVDLLTGGPRAPDGERWSVEAATPNWLLAGTQNDETDAGPGARPEPVPPEKGSPRGRWTFRFENGDRGDLVGLVAEAHERPQPNGVVVAVLDTSPRQSDVARAKSDPRYANNLLLQDVLADKRIVIDDTYDAPGTLRVSPGYRSPVVPDTNGEPAGASDPQVDPRPFLMPDHGLFATGIIRDIAPGPAIHLIRVLNDFGVGDLQTLADVLSQLPAKFSPNDKRRLVVNLSLVADIPPGVNLFAGWLPATYRRLEKTIGPHLRALQPTTADIASELNALGANGRSILALLDATHLALSEVVLGLVAQKIVVVAAAGNENEPAGVPGAVTNPNPPEPCWPARYESVLGVAAAKGDRKPAAYSNRGDVTPLRNGVAVYGGNAAFAGPGQPRRIDTTAGRKTDAIRGIFSLPDLPMGAGPNQTGWVFWAGTSFAAPIATALVANYLAFRDPAADAPAVIDAVRGFGTNIGTAPDPDGPLDCKTIVAWQEYVNR